MTEQMTEKMTEKMIVMESIDNAFKSLSNQLNDHCKLTRGLQDELKSLQKIVKQNSKSYKIKNKRPQPKLNVSKELSKFLDIENNITLTKAEVMKSVSNYIKEKNLQVQEDKRKFLPDKVLTKIFGIKTAHNMTFVEINKHVSPHLSPLSV